MHAFLLHQNRLPGSLLPTTVQKIKHTCKKMEAGTQK
jgi:hypothetical protein